MNNCLFCKIASGEISSETVFEDEYIKIFKDIHPKAPTHLLVIPKKHIESIKTLQAEDLGTVSNMLLGAKKIAEKLGLQGYKLVFNVGREGGQIIDHLHLHILGSWDKNPGGVDPVQSPLGGAIRG